MYDAVDKGIKHRCILLVNAISVWIYNLRYEYRAIEIISFEVLGHDTLLHKIALLKFQGYVCGNLFQTIIE